MGRKQPFQLLKPNGASVECTAEVMGSGLDLKNLLPNSRSSHHDHSLFHFKFVNIRALRCVSEDSIELEVLNSKDGKIGKVKLRSPGPHGLAESPVQELQRELESAMTMNGIGQHSRDPAATTAGRGGLSPRSGTYNCLSIESTRSPSRLRHDSLSNGGELNDHHKWRDQQRHIQSISSNDSLAIGHSKSRGASMGVPPLSPCESPREYCSPIGNGSHHRWPRLSLKSIDSSSNSAVESQHIAGNNAKPIRSSLEQGMFKGQDDSTYGSSCRTVIEHEASKSITMSGIQESHGGLLLESIAQELCLRDGTPSTWHERRLSQCSTTSTVSNGPKQQQDSSSELFPDHSALAAGLDESTEAEAVKARKHDAHPWAPHPHKYSNPLFNDSHQSNRSISSDGIQKISGVGHHQQKPAEETDVMVIMHDHAGREDGGKLAPGSKTAKPGKWSPPDGHDRAQQDVEEPYQGIAGDDRPEEDEEGLLEASHLCDASESCSMGENHGVSSPMTNSREKSKPFIGSRQEAPSNERGLLSKALEKVNELLSSKREMEQELERIRKALQKAEQEAANERQGRKVAESNAQDARQELAEVWGNLQQVKLQILEAEQSAQEADDACVAANEARAALKIELEAAKRRIKRLVQGSRGDTDSCHSEAAADSRQDHAAVSRQVQQLREELQMVDEAAAMAMEKARQESSRSEALEAELEQMRAFLNESSMRQSQSRQEDTDTLEMFCHSLQMQSPKAASLDRGLSGTPDGASEQASGNNQSSSPMRGNRQKDALGVMGLQELKDQMAARQHGDDVITELQSRLAASRRETRQLQAAQQATEEALQDAKADAEKCRQRASRMQERMEAMTWQLEEAKGAAAEARDQAAAGKSAAARAEQQAGKLQQRLRASEAAAKHAERAAAKASEALRQEAHKLTVRLEESRELLGAEEQELVRAMEEIKRLKAALKASQESRGGQLQPGHASSKARSSTKEVDLALAQRNSAREEANLLRKRLEMAEAERLRMEAEMRELKHLRRLLKESGATIRAAAAAQSSAEGMARELEGRLRTVYKQVGWGGATASGSTAAANEDSIDWDEQEPDSTVIEVGDAAAGIDHEYTESNGRHQRHAAAQHKGKSSSSNRGSRASRHSSSTDNLPMQHEGGRHQQTSPSLRSSANDVMSWVSGAGDMYE